MSAREELEAVFWRNLPARDPETVRLVDLFLTCADAYAVAVQHETEDIPEDTPQATARRRAILDLAIADLYDTKSHHEWRVS